MTTRPVLTAAELRTLDGYWRAANYLSVDGGPLARVTSEAARSR